MRRRTNTSTSSSSARRILVERRQPEGSPPPSMYDGKFCCRRRRRLSWPLFTFLLLASVVGRAATSGSSSTYWYSNVTLSSLDGDLSVVVYLPQGLKPEERSFYSASRFDHGSMIGSITRRVRSIDSDGTESVRRHVLFESDMWRQPHNSNWPESGVGLASEFGVGDDGAFCYYRCGWLGVNDVTNGVLGYREAKSGESFLKIGVGELVKGTCPKCDSTEDYRFNSPYQFAKAPEWKILEISDHGITLEHEARVNIFGYKLVKEISLDNNVLSVTTSLTNLSLQPFSTAWYSHNFFSCDGTAVGPGYTLDLGLKGDTNPLYDEPGTWSWSTPLEDYANVKRYEDKVRVDMERALTPGVRIKTEFANDQATKGTFKMHACGTTIKSEIAEVGRQDGLSMYGYNLYIERGTLSPEPQILIYLDPGATASWTQRLTIEDDSPPQPPPPAPSFQFFKFSLKGLDPLSAPSPASRSYVKLFGFFSMLIALSSVALFASRLQRIRMRARHRTRFQYASIPDLEEDAVVAVVEEGR